MIPPSLKSFHGFSSQDHVSFFLATPHGTWDLSSPMRDRMHPLQWKRGVLTTELPGKSQDHVSLSPASPASGPCLLLQPHFQPLPYIFMFLQYQTTLSSCIYDAFLLIQCVCSQSLFYLG